MDHTTDIFPSAIKGMNTSLCSFISSFVVLTQWHSCFQDASWMLCQSSEVFYLSRQKLPRVRTHYSDFSSFSVSHICPALQNCNPSCESIEKNDNGRTKRFSSPGDVSLTVTVAGPHRCDREELTRTCRFCLFPLVIDGSTFHPDFVFLFLLCDPNTRHESSEKPHAYRSFSGDWRPEAWKTELTTCFPVVWQVLPLITSGIWWWKWWKKIWALREYFWLYLENNQNSTYQICNFYVALNFCRKLD